MYARLLSCADAYRLTVNSEADGVGLSILQCDEGDDEVALRGRRQFLIFSDDVFKQGLVNFEVVSSLLESYTEYLLCLLYLRDIVRIDFNYVVVAAPLGLQYLKCLGLVPGSYDAVGDLTLDEVCRGDVADV